MNVKPTATSEAPFMLNTLQDAVRRKYVYQCRKHDLAAEGQDADAYADDQLNKLTNAEFLAELSDGLTVLFEEARANEKET